MAAPRVSRHGNYIKVVNQRLEKSYHAVIPMAYGLRKERVARCAQRKATLAESYGKRVLARLMAWSRLCTCREIAGDEPGCPFHGGYFTAERAHETTTA